MPSHTAHQVAEYQDAKPARLMIATVVLSTDGCSTLPCGNVHRSLIERLSRMGRTSLPSVPLITNTSRCTQVLRLPSDSAVQGAVVWVLQWMRNDCHSRPPFALNFSTTVSFDKSVRIYQAALTLGLYANLSPLRQDILRHLNDLPLTPKEFSVIWVALNNFSCCPGIINHMLFKTEDHIQDGSTGEDDAKAIYQYIAAQSKLQQAMDRILQGRARHVQRVMQQAKHREAYEAARQATRRARQGRCINQHLLTDEELHQQHQESFDRKLDMARGGQRWLSEKGSCRGHVVVTSTGVDGYDGVGSAASRHVVSNV